MFQEEAARHITEVVLQKTYEIHVIKMEYLSDTIITIQSLMTYKSMAVAFILLCSIILFTPSKAFKTNPISSSTSSWRDLKLKPLLIDTDSSTSIPSPLSQLKKTLQLDDIRISKLLEDFSSPFLQDSLEVKEEQDTVVVQNKKQNENENSKKRGVTHFCFLVHGYNGKPSDLLYLRSVMVDEAEQKIEESQCDKIVFHSCQTNYGKTSDGVEAGGERILQEIQSVIAKHTNETGNEKEENITVSLIGNSLGGLYSRYAVAKLSNRSSSRNSSSSNDDATEESSMDEEFVTMDGNLKVHFNIFCTTATPHLGISGHTYFPIPRTAEIGIGKIMVSFRDKRKSPKIQPKIYQKGLGWILVDECLADSSDSFTFLIFVRDKLEGISSACQILFTQCAPVLHIYNH